MLGDFCLAFRAFFLFVYFISLISLSFSFILLYVFLYFSVIFLSLHFYGLLSVVYLLLGIGLHHGFVSNSLLVAFLICLGIVFAPHHLPFHLFLSSSLKPSPSHPHGRTWLPSTHFAHVQLRGTPPPLTCPQKPRGSILSKGIGD